MDKKNFDIYFEFNYSNINLAAFDNLNDQLKYYKEQDYKSHFENLKQINFESLQNLVEKNVRELEKSISELIKEINLIVDTPETTSLKLSIMKNSVGKKISKEDLMYLIQDAKQQIMKSNRDLNIMHILVEKYILDNIEFKTLPDDKICHQFSIDIEFICLPKNLIKKFEKLFLNQQISIKRFICFNYLKNFFNNNTKKNICQLGRDIIAGANKQEVVLVPKVNKKKGFFEKLFYLFK